MTTNTQKKAPGASDSKGLHTDTNTSHFVNHGVIQQASSGKAFITRLTAVYTNIMGAIGSIDLLLALMTTQFVLIVWEALI